MRIIIVLILTLLIVPSAQCKTDAGGLTLQQSQAAQAMARGDSYAKSNDFEQALRCYKDAVRILPQEPKFHFILASAAWNQKDVTLASEQFSKAVELDKDFADAYFGLGQCQTKSSDFKGATASFKENVRLKPDNASAWFELGSAYDQLTDSSNAKEAYLACLEHESSPERLMTIGQHLKDKKYFSLARASFDKVLTCQNASDSQLKIAKESRRKLEKTQ